MGRSPVCTVRTVTVSTFDSSSLIYRSIVRFFNLYIYFIFLHYPFSSQSGWIGHLCLAPVYTLNIHFKHRMPIRSILVLKVQLFVMDLPLFRLVILETLFFTFFFL